MKGQNSANSTKKRVSFVQSISIAITFGLLITILISMIELKMTSYKDITLKLDSSYKDLALVTILNNSILAQNLVDIQKYLTKGLDSGLEVLASFLGNFKKQYDLPEVSREASSFIEIVSSGIYKFFVIFLLCLKLVVAKLINVFCGGLLYVFAALLGLVDGLVVRYVRTMQAGRESTFVFHHVSKILMHVPAIVLFIYICTPFALNIIAVNVAIAFVIFAGCRNYGSQLKKYL